MLISLAVGICVLSIFALADLECRPEGPVLSKPRALWKAEPFKDAAANLTKAIEAALAGDIPAGWVTDNSSFSLAVVSLDQPDPAVPIWEYHYLSPNNTNGTQELSRDTQYLIGSVTKVFTDLVLLKSGLDLDRPITDFVPELSNVPSEIQWSSITLRALGSQLSGVPANYGFSEFYYFNEYWVSVGFPPLNDSAYPTCGVAGLNGSEACNRTTFLSGVINAHPVTAPMESPAYSNIAFQLLSYAVEEATGKNYTELMRVLVAEPLGLKNTYPSPGNMSNAVIPPGNITWDVDYGIYLPGGGLVSSASDLAALCHGILARTILSPELTRQWLKPQSFLGSPYTFVGFPWEIYVPPGLVPEHPHTVTTYNKAGGAAGYRTRISIVDEYGLGLVVLTAGAPFGLSILWDALLATFVPAADEASRQQATQYTGPFSNDCSSPDTCVGALIVQDEDSLVIGSVTRNETDILSGILTLWIVAVGPYISGLSPQVRLFPTELAKPDTLDGKAVIRETWRLWPELPYMNVTGLPGSGLGSHDCRAWTIGDWVHYGSFPADRWDFILDLEGNVVGLDIPFLRSGIMRPQRQAQEAESK